MRFKGGISSTLKMEAAHSFETLIPTYGEWSAGKNMEENGRDLTELLSRHLSGVTKENHETHW